MRPAAVLVPAVALALAAPGASALRYSSVAKGTAARGEPDRAFIALDRGAVSAFSARLRPAHRPRVVAVDFRRFAIVAAFFTLPTPCQVYGVRSIERRGRALVVSVVTRARRGPCILPLTPAYHVVKLPRSALGTPSPRRVRLRVAVLR